MLPFLAEEAVPAGTGLGGTLIMFVALLAVFYFFMIRPENKKKKEAEAMRAAIKTGDKITTIGGIMGTVVHVKDESLIIETSADRVRMELKKWSVSTNDTAEAEKAAAKAAAKPVKKEKK